MDTITFQLQPYQRKGWVSSLKRLVEGIEKLEAFLENNGGGQIPACMKIVAELKENLRELQQFKVTFDPEKPEPQTITLDTALALKYSEDLSEHYKKACEDTNTAIFAAQVRGEMDMLSEAGANLRHDLRNRVNEPMGNLDLICGFLQVAITLPALAEMRRQAAAKKDAPEVR